MPESDLKPSNRERLLRLIDGGTEALKEFQTEGAPAKKVEPTALPKKPTGARLLQDWRKKIPVSDKEALRLLRWLIAVVGVVIVFQYGLAALKTFHPGNTAAVPVPAGTEDASGVGLKLVGVDTSEPPVALLEDLATGKTYFVRKNERVKGARVTQIQKNKVRISVGGRNVELQ